MSKRLTYWFAQRNDGKSTFAIREKTKKEALRQIELRTDDYEQFSPPHKVVVEYANALDLLKQCLGEGSIYEEWRME